eukprot:GCRY01000955.1.p1 GENE.GCRY01000955.1~~GCRY01000955.1.p1  ORF type:complete len:245 (+),score=31.13 GCRY01000955.1:234-968(+)
MPRTHSFSPVFWVCLFALLLGVVTPTPPEEDSDQETLKPIVGRINGGLNEMEMGVGDNLLLTDDSFDPDFTDQRQANMLRQWGCTVASTTKPCLFPQLETTGTRIVINTTRADSTMIEGETYIFALHVQQGSRTSNTTLAVRVVAGVRLPVRLVGRVFHRVNPALPLVLPVAGGPAPPPPRIRNGLPARNLRNSSLSHMNKACDCHNNNHGSVLSHHRTDHHDQHLCQHKSQGCFHEDDFSVPS